MKKIISSISYFASNGAGIFLIALAFTLCSRPVFAQEEATTEKKEASNKKPARPAFESPQLMDEQSVVVPSAKTLEFNIQHRFGLVNNGVEDLYGIYAPGANVRLTFSYTPIENLSLGFGYAKLKQYLDFNAKYAILKQRRDWSIPVSVTYFGNWAIDNRPDKYEKTVHRFSFYNQLIIASRISDKVSIQVSPSFSHYNAIDSLLSHDMIAIGISGRYKFSDQSSLVINYTHQLTKHDDVNYKVKPGLTVGWEVATSGHAFQIFASTFQGILGQENMTFNQNDFTKGEFLIGFNITRLWNF
ncbi:MAG: hypothetical protein JNM78_15950 [Cyclobacteriaceae bacterium]|nr:hypothetical protein [Cyclobacteriaceae bacterium]